MTTVRGVASGKIILFGEHAVVYGRPAIAVPVRQVQAQAILETTNPGHGFVVDALDLKRSYRLSTAPANDPIATIIRLTLGRLTRPDPPDALLSLTSTIPLGRGLGSGAAISTAIVRALARFFQQPLNPEEISALVYDVEKLYHGTPSGIDNTVIAFEQPVYFVKGKPIERMRAGWPFTLVIADTGLVAPTHQVVGDLRRRWQAEPARYEVYFDQIGAIVNRARRTIEHGPADLNRLGRLMDDNQAILTDLGVSSPELNWLINTARQAGALGAKLSGAGWGGNMIALVEPEQATAVAQSLSDAGATATIVTRVAVFAHSKKAK